VNNLICLILAGGFGTRLRSVVADVPKPLAPVAGKPFLYWLLKNLKKQGGKEVILSLHHQAGIIQEFLQSVTFDLEIQTVVEPAPLGTGGAIAFAIQQMEVQTPFVVMNGDTWLGQSLIELQSHLPPAIGLVHVEDTSRYGRVAWQNDLVQSFKEKQPKAGPGWINAGAYHLSSEDFANWDGQPCSLECDLLPKWVQQGRLGACPLKTDFIDIGVPEDYQRFCQWQTNKMLK
jgi:NDP-sugar pyrophosphorylase family protein